MIMKWLFKKKLLANVEDNIAVAEDFFVRFQKLLLQKSPRERLNYAVAVVYLVEETAAKFSISPRSALYGDTLTWQQLADAIDDWDVAIEAAGRLSQNDVSELAKSHGIYIGHAILLARVVYNMKFSQQQFPEIMGEQISSLYHVSTQLSQLFYDLVNGTKTDDQLLLFVHELRFG